MFPFVALFALWMKVLRFFDRYVAAAFAILAFSDIDVWSGSCLRVGLDFVPILSDRKA